MSQTTAPKGRILIGEDVREIADDMLTALNSAGYLCELTHDGEQCLRRAREERPDLVLLDIMMPKLHGIEVLRALRSSPETAGIDVIMCSAKAYKSDQHDCEALGCIAFLVKPFKMEELVTLVDSYFARDSSVAVRDIRYAPEVREVPFCPVLDTSHGIMRLWGTRGSTPTPGADFLGHGGHTSCLSIEHEGEVFIFDAGSGIRDLGQKLMDGPVLRVNLFVTHTHWDHIQGFPFFMPAYSPDFEITVWGAEGFGKNLESIFSGQLDRDYFPVQMDDMHSSLHFKHLSENPVVVNGVKIHWEYAQHPGATVGYKIEIGGRKIVWLPDNEFLQGYVGAPEDVTRDNPFVAPYRKIIEFLSDADVVVHEAQYTNEEYLAKIGWGHCCVSNACLLMKFANVKRWIITHHDPNHDDNFLEKKLSLTRQILKRIGHEMKVEHGRDGMEEPL